MTTPRLPARPALRWLLFLLTFGLAVSLWTPTASAVDNTLASSVPGNGASLESFAGPIELTFANPVGPNNDITMTCDGDVISVGQAAPQANGITVVASVGELVPKGSCTIAWSVTDVDLQPAGSGSISFTVTSDPVVESTTTAVATTLLPGDSTSTTTPPITVPPGGVGNEPDTPNTTGPLGLFRLFSNLFLAILFGSLVFIAVAWPEGVEYDLTIRFLRSTWILAAVSAYLFAGAVAADVTGGGLGAALSPSSLFDLFDTGHGKAALLRLVFVLISGYVITQPDRAIDPGSQLPALVPPGIAVVTMAFSRPEFGFIDYAVGTIHVLGMSVWLGGLVLLSRVVLAGPGDEDLVHAVRGFRQLANPALIATVGSGAIQFIRLDQGALGSGHGLVMILKVLLVAGMVFVGVATRQFVAQRMTRVETMSAPLAMRLKRALGMEAAIGVVVIMFTAWLLALTPPGLNTASSLELGAKYRFQNQTISFDVSVAFTERVGANDVRIEVLSAPVTGITGLAVDFIAPEGSAIIGLTINDIPLTGEGTAELSKSDGFALIVPGTWTIRVRLGDVVIAQQDVLISE